MIRLQLLLFLAHHLLCNANQIKIDIANDSLSAMDVFWVQPGTNELVKMNPEPIPHGSTTPYYSQVGHEFWIQELPNAAGACQNAEQVCRTALVQVTGLKEDSKC